MAGLPFPEIVDHRIGDFAYQTGRNFVIIHLKKMFLNVSCRHAERVHRNDFFIKTVEPTLMLRNDLGLKITLPITRNIDLKFIIRAFYFLGAVAVALITVLAFSVLLMTGMVG